MNTSRYGTPGEGWQASFSLLDGDLLYDTRDIYYISPVITMQYMYSLRMYMYILCGLLRLSTLPSMTVIVHIIYSDVHSV